MKSKRTLIAGLVGFAYIFIYGSFAAFETGGGHGNFVWIMLFIFVNCFGLYFPIMAMLGVNLRSYSVRMIFSCLLAANLVASIVMIAGWITETSGDGMPTDFERSYNVVGASGLIICGVIHFLPSVLFLVLLIRSFLSTDEITGTDAMSLKVP